MIPYLLAILLGAGDLDPERVEGAWCLTSLATASGTVRQPRETWQFADDGALVVDGRGEDGLVHWEAVYEVVGQRITTSLALTLVVLSLSDDEMIARIGEEQARFLRGRCDQ